MPAWRDLPVWRVLDTDFSDGARFLACWAAWKHDPRRPRVLHYVAIAEHAPASLAPAPNDDDLRRQWQGLEPGFHRLELSAGRVLLTLCVGPLQATLREQEFVADAVCVAHTADAAGRPVWDRWSLRALVRLCRRGTTLAIAGAPVEVLHSVTEAGFVLEAPPVAGTHHGSFQPRWELPTSRHRWRGPAAPVADCAIVGAGLAGAAAAASLARRGWAVTVLDAAPAPAAGASALPVGLLVPQVSRDDGARTRLTRAGARMTHQWCHTLLHPGGDWAPCGVQQQRLDATPPEGVWHPNGAWIKPARLVAACLDHPDVVFRGGARVTQVQHDGGDGQLSGADGAVLARARQLVIAAAAGSMPLLECIRRAMAPTGAGLPHYKPMQILGGQVSWGMQRAGDAAHFPAGPVNGHGSFVPHVPTDGAFAWYAGASYETDTAPRLDAHTSDLENLGRLARLLPDVAHALAPRFSAGEVHFWHGERCATTDRLPVVGPLLASGMPPVWISASMGSRGLTYAVLCAEILAARLGGEPLPLEGSLARLLAAARPGLVSSHHL